jgi:cell division protein FtsQ
VDVGDVDPPFLRPERRTRARRQRRGWAWRALVAVQLVGAALAAFAAVWAGYARVLASERLRVVKVEVRGNRFLSEGEVRELLGPAVGGNILSIDIHALKSALRASPWVADATVARTLPDTLRIDIRERVPLALAEVDRLYLMDGDGTLIDIYGPRTAGFDLPIVRGLKDAEPEERRLRAGRAGALLDDLGDLAGEVSEVAVDGEGELRVSLRGAGEILRLGPPPWRSRFVTFLSLREELRRRCPRAEYFDLRFKGRIYAKEPLVAPAFRDAEVNPASLPRRGDTAPPHPPSLPAGTESPDPSAVVPTPAPPGGPVAEG